LALYNGSKPRAERPKILGLHRNTLRSRMKKLGIGRKTHEIA
jgi:hypothetical protein